MTRIQEARDNLRATLNRSFTRKVWQDAEGMEAIVRAAEQLIDAKLSESAAGRREAEDEPIRVGPPSGPCPKCFGAVDDFGKCRDCDGNGRAERVATIRAKYGIPEPEREAEPGGGDEHRPDFKTIASMAGYSVTLPEGVPNAGEEFGRCVDAKALAGYLESMWNEGRDAGRKQRDEKLAARAEARLRDIHELEERAEKSEADHDEAKQFLAEMNRQLYDALECDGHPSWLDDIIPRAHQVVRLRKEAEAELAAAKAILGSVESSLLAALGIDAEGDTPRGDELARMAQVELAAAKGRIADAVASLRDIRGYLLSGQAETHLAAIDACALRALDALAREA